MDVRIARVYEAPEPEEGVRVLVDRLWPRGVKKEGAPWEHWLPEVAPSPDLRQWFNHEAAKFDLFQKQYLTELASPKGRAAVQRLTQLAGGRPLILMTATADTEHNQAVVLRRLLLGEVAAPR